MWKWKNIVFKHQSVINCPKKGVLEDIMEYISYLMDTIKIVCASMTTTDLERGSKIKVTELNSKYGL